MWLFTLQLSVRNLMLHKLRSLLTMLGTILGVGSVIAMLAIGEGSMQEAVEQIRQLGATNVIVRSVKPDQEGVEADSTTSSGQTQSASRVLEYGLRYKDFERLTATMPTIRRAVPIALVRRNAQFGRRRIMNARILGTHCEACGLTYVPATMFCERCFAELEQWVEVPNRGWLFTYTVLHRDLDDKPLDPPVILAYVKLEGTDGGLVHYIGEIDPEDLCIGMEVEAVFKEAAEREGSILDIEYFQPVRG